MMKLDVPSLAVGVLLTALLAASSSAPCSIPEDCIDTKTLRILDTEGRVRLVLTADEDFPRMTMLEPDGAPLLELGRPLRGGDVGLRMTGRSGEELASFTVGADKFGDRSRLRLLGEAGANVTAWADASSSLLQVFTGSVEEGRGVKLSADEESVLLQMSGGPEKSGVTVTAEGDDVYLTYWPDHLHGANLIRLRKPRPERAPWLYLGGPDGEQILSR